MAILFVEVGRGRPCQVRVQAVVSNAHHLSILQPLFESLLMFAENKRNLFPFMIIKAR